MTMSSNPQKFHPSRSILAVERYLLAFLFISMAGSHLQHLHGTVFAHTLHLYIWQFYPEKHLV